MSKTKTKSCINDEILSPADQELYAAEARKWILEHYDRKVVDTSEINYRLNDEICCSRVINSSGVTRGILTIWREHDIWQHHFDKR